MSPPRPRGSLARLEGRAASTWALAVLLSGCAADLEGDLSAASTQPSNLTLAQRRTRAGLIRDTAARAGLPRAGWLLAGLADAETQMSHCWSELTWACQGPYAADCRGPVVAGAGDGPCSARQGGLGMFQFDGGDFDATLRREWIARIRAAGGRLVSLIHPAVHCADSARMGEGLLIHAFTAIYPGAVVGDGCVLESQVAVGPEVSVGSICVIAAGATLCNRSGIGEGSFIGTRSVVCPGVVVGPGCRVGAGSTVNRDVPPFKVAAGSPARFIRDETPQPGVEPEESIR